MQTIVNGLLSGHKIRRSSFLRDFLNNVFNRKPEIISLDSAVNTYIGTIKINKQ